MTLKTMTNRLHRALLSRKNTLFFCILCRRGGFTSSSRCKKFVCRPFFDGGEIRNFLDMEILNFTWLPWQPDTVTGSGYPPVFKTRPIMF